MDRFGQAHSFVERAFGAIRRRIHQQTVDIYINAELRDLDGALPRKRGNPPAKLAIEGYSAYHGPHASTPKVIAATKDR
jgi:hypothetical protein